MACIAVTNPQVDMGDELLAAMGTEVADYLQTLKSKSKVGGLEFPIGSMQLLGSCATVCCVTAERLVSDGIGCGVIYDESRQPKVACARLWKCDLCPFRTFPRRDRLVDHVCTCHTRERPWICSGTKQIKVVAFL